MIADIINNNSDELVATSAWFITIPRISEKIMYDKKCYLVKDVIHLPPQVIINEDNEYTNLENHVILLYVEKLQYVPYNIRY